MVFYPKAIWDFYFKKDNIIYLTFDDGPNQETTPLILKMLDDENIKATFFCLGKNAQEYPELITDLKQQGHQIAAHGMKHISGLKSSNKYYLNNALESLTFLETNYFRPPYGKLKISQYKALVKHRVNLVMWSVMAYDFDSKLTSQRRLVRLQKKVKAGDIIVFHDNHKSIENLKHELPQLLKYWRQKNYKFSTIKN